MGKKYLNIFLLGRPGCGKSQVFNLLTGKIKEEKISRQIKIPKDAGKQTMVDIR